ncbi:hypothetical protein ACFPRL_25375 [Pseudoclavibacter helvolus]
MCWLLTSPASMDGDHGSSGNAASSSRTIEGMSSSTASRRLTRINPSPAWARWTARRQRRAGR